MTDLLDYAVAEGKTDTSRAAAEAIAPRAPIIRQRVAEALRFGATLTADEMAAYLGLSILAVRPRFTELKNLGLIEPTGRRRRNRGGRSQIIWRWKPGAKL